MDGNTDFEKKMARVNSQVVFFKNIDSEDFTHAYAGVPHFVSAGQTVVFQYPVAMHLAKHLAMKILRRRKKKAGIVGDKDKVGNTIKTHTPQEIDELRKQIIVKTVDQPLPPEQSYQETMKKEQESLAKEFSDDLKELNDEAPKTEVTKKDIVADLKKRGIKFDPRAPKNELLDLLMKSEEEGDNEE